METRIREMTGERVVLGTEDVKRVREALAIMEQKTKEREGLLKIHKIS